MRYDGEDVTEPIKDQKEIRGTLTQQLRQIDEVLKSAHLHRDAVRGAPPGLPDYPAVALRELIRDFRDLARKIEDRIGLADDTGDPCGPSSG